MEPDSAHSPPAARVWRLWWLWVMLGIGILMTGLVLYLAVVPESTPFLYEAF